MILKAGEPLPAGSPKLKPHYTSHGSRICEIKETFIADTWIYSYSCLTSELNTAKKHKIYYFSGGGFRGGPTKEHWTLCAELCTQLPDHEVNLVSYPLVPNSPAASSLPHLERLYEALKLEALEQGSWITLMGDSAGGNIVLVLGVYAATKWLEDAANKDRLCPVRCVFAICPATDLRHENIEIDAKESKDPLLSRKIIEEVAKGWYGEMSASDPRISPALADLSVLQQADIKVDGVLGGYDILAPEGVAFREKLLEVGVKGDWLEWEKQMHCFVLMFQYRLPEPSAAKDWILDVLRANAKVLQ
jgi:acetyl esterase/lipase